MEHMQLSLLTFNVNFVFARNPSNPETNANNVVQAIRESNCSIIALQETHQGWEQVLRGYLSDLYPNQLYYHHRGAGGQAFLSKFPFGEQRIIDTNKNSGSWFPVHIVHVLIPASKENINENKIIRLVNVHLRPPVNPDGSAFLFTARNTNKFRLAEVKYVAQSCNWDEGIECPTLILGDFNENDDAPAISWLKNSFGFVDALHEFVPSNRETHRWRILWGTWLLLKRLDHILYSEHFICSSCSVIDGYEENASDHQPVKGTFMLK